MAQLLRRGELRHDLLEPAAVARRIAVVEHLVRVRVKARVRVRVRVGVRVGLRLGFGFG